MYLNYMVPVKCITAVHKHPSYKRIEFQALNLSKTYIVFFKNVYYEYFTVNWTHEKNVG